MLGQGTWPGNQALHSYRDDSVAASVCTARTVQVQPHTRVPTLPDDSRTLRLSHGSLITTETVVIIYNLKKREWIVV